MSEINLPSSLYFYIDFHRLQVRSALGTVSRTAIKRGCLSLPATPSIPVTMRCCELLTAVMKRGGEAKRKKEKLANVSNEMSTHRWGGGGQKKRKKKRKKEGFAEVLLDESMVPSCFSTPTGIYLSRARTHNVQWYSKVLSVSAFFSLPVSLSFSLSRRHVI